MQSWSFTHHRPIMLLTPASPQNIQLSVALWCVAQLYSPLWNKKMPHLEGFLGHRDFVTAKCPIFYDRIWTAILLKIAFLICACVCISVFQPTHLLSSHCFFRKNLKHTQEAFQVESHFFGFTATTTVTTITVTSQSRRLQLRPASSCPSGLLNREGMIRRLVPAALPQSADHSSTTVM